MATLLEEIKPLADIHGVIGSDQELDEFMDCYCRILEKYEEELSKPFNEAEMFLNSVETQLRSLCSNGKSILFFSIFDYYSYVKLEMEGLAIFGSRPCKAAKERDSSLLCVCFVMSLCLAWWSVCFASSSFETHGG